MSFVYAPYRGREAASDAVDALIDHSVPLRAIRVLAERPGQPERVPIVHTRPIGRGALAGAVVGLFAGTLVGAILANEAARSSVTVHPALGVLAGILGGAFIGALAGLGTWRNRPAFPASVNDHCDVLVGANVGRGRVREVQSVLEHAGASDTFIAARV